MKYKIISLLVVVLLISIAFTAQRITIKSNRYHQHLEALPKEPCTDHGDDVFCTHLPLMDITTEDPVPEPYLVNESGERVYNENGSSIQNNEMVSATVKYFDSATENNHLTDEPVVQESAMIRVRGASSRSFDKKGYLLKFKEENLTDNKDVSLSGMTADSDWVLNGPFLDKTLIRNYLCYNLSGEIMDYAPNVRFCELFLNGEYMGLYLIVEKVGYNENGRINITQSDPDMKMTSYIVLADRGADDSRYALNTFASYSHLGKENGGGHLEIVYPSKTLTPEQHDFIEDDFSKFEKALYSFDYSDPKRGYQKYIDVESAIDYFLINEFTLNYDAFDLSTYLYRDIRGKLKFCVWDFNSAFDYYHNSSVSPETFQLQDRMWNRYLFKDPAFVNQVVRRYKQLRKSYLNEEYLCNYIDETVTYLGPAIERNYEKWGYSFESEYNGINYDYLEPAERNVRTYDQAIEQLKSCITQRIIFMDNNLDRLYSLCHESVNKKYNQNMGEGLN